MPRLPTDGGAVFGMSDIPSYENIERIHQTKHVKNPKYHDPLKNGLKGMALLMLKFDLLHSAIELKWP